MHGIRRQGRQLLRYWIALLLLVGTLVAAGVTSAATTLKDAISTAITSNPQILSAQASSRAAGHDVRQARGGYYPSIDMSGGVGSEDSNIKQLNLAGNDAGTLTRREFGLSLRQLVFDGFGTKSTVARRIAQLEAAESNASDVRESVAFQTVQVFVDVLQNRELVALAKRNVARHQSTYDDVAEKVKSGVGQNADAQQAQGRLALARSTLTAREGRLLESISNYERVVGQRPGELLAPERRPSGLTTAGTMDPSLIENAIQTGISEALDQHPAMRQARAEVEAAEADIDAAKANYWPTVELQAHANRDGNLAGVEGVRNVNTVLLVGRWNLFRGGSDQAQERGAIERRSAAADAAADTERAIRENVATAYKAKATSDSRIAYLEAHVQASAATLESYKAQFELARRTLLDTLNAENELFNARSNLVVGQHGDLLNQYFIEASKGLLVRSMGLTGP